jgi:hypothetical protein
MEGWCLSTKVHCVISPIFSAAKISGALFWIYVVLCSDVNAIPKLKTDQTPACQLRICESKLSRHVD